MNHYELYHHGVLGMKWGIRRYQNPDGTLTAEGKRKYRKDPKFAEKYDKHQEQKAKPTKQKIKEFITNENTIIAGSVFAATCLSAYGMYKLGQKNPQKYWDVIEKSDEMRMKIDKFMAKFMPVVAAGIALKEAYQATKEKDPEKRMRKMEKAEDIRRDSVRLERPRY